MDEKLGDSRAQDRQDATVKRQLPDGADRPAGPVDSIWAASARCEDIRKNTDERLSGFFSERLPDETFQRIADIIRTELGIKMPDVKKVMLEARLRKRLRALGLKTFSEYADYLFGPDGLDHEIVHLLDVVTTNKTDFFREPRHYDLLRERVLPDLIPQLNSRPLKVWSAGCSSGKEPYTLAIVLSEYAASHGTFDYSITGTDVSTQVLHAAMEAIYKEEDIKDVSEELKKKYFLRSRDREAGLVRVSKALRDKVLFHRLNFMEETYDMDRDFDLVFCRNVMIYFDRATQNTIINRICRHIRPGGYLFLGHSETLMGITAPLRQIVSTLYQRIDEHLTHPQRLHRMG